MLNSKTSQSLALIGGGNWGKNLARSFYSEGVLHTLCDLNEEHLKCYAEKYPDVELTTDFKKILSNPQITKIAIATPPPTHYHLVKQALLAGKDVFVEKPLCMNFDQGVELSQLAATRGLVLMTGHILQYHPIVNLIQNFVRNEIFGSILSLKTQRFNPISFYKEEDVLWDLGPHDISLLLSFCTNQSPLNVVSKTNCLSKGGILDAATFHMDFPSGIEAEIEFSRLSPNKQQKLEITCEKALIVFDDTKIWNEKLSIESNTDRPLNGSKLEILETLTRTPSIEPLRRECDHFLYCCKERLEAITCTKEALGVVHVLESMDKVLRTIKAL